MHIIQLTDDRRGTSLNGSTEDVSSKLTSTNNSRGNVSFIPPSFPSKPTEDGLIKPSEYLKSLGGSSKGNSHLNDDGGSSHLTVIQETSEEQKYIPTPPPVPPAPPLPPTPSSLGGVSQNEGSNSPSVSSINRNGHQMPHISVTDLQSVQLKKTEKISKSTSVPLKFGKFLTFSFLI